MIHPRLPRSVGPLLGVFLIAAAVGLLFESTKQLVFPKITIWQSHSVTIVFFAICSTVAASWALRRRSVLFKERERQLSDLQRADAALSLSEQRFRLLYERSLAGVFCTALDGRILRCNEAAAHILGYESSGDVLASRATDLYLDAAGRPEFIGRLKRDRSLTSFELRLRCKDGTPVWLLMNVHLVQPEDGGPEVIEGTFLDITGQKRLQDALAQARDEALAASQAKSAFLANMSHELRTPLNAILGYAQLTMRDPSFTAAARNNLNIINHSGEHLLGLIDDVLDMSKIEAGCIELHPVEFDLGDVLNELAAMFRVRTEAKGLALQVRMEGLEQRILADQRKLRQVLINLLGNAVKFTKLGHIKVQASIDSREEDQPWLSVQVEDTGVGIAPEEQAQLFRPFVQTQSGVGLRSGTGLGLAISREFVRRMGGEITVASVLGQGSVFRLSIPVQRGSAGPIPLSPARRRVIGLRRGSPAPRVLIVDDDPNNRGWIAALLASVGFEVRLAESGPEAIRLSRQWSPQLILMDIHMPRMDGLETTRTIRANATGDQPVVIAFTASVMDTDRGAIIQSGIDDFLAKPCRETDLLDKLQTHLKVEYLLEPDLAPRETEVPAAKAQFQPAQMPEELTAALQQAVLCGDKELLDTLIHEVQGLDTQSASALQALADGYEYDALTRLLEETRA